MLFSNSMQLVLGLARPGLRKWNTLSLPGVVVVVVVLQVLLAVGVVVQADLGQAQDYL
jgi:hypothetical protein